MNNEHLDKLSIRAWNGLYGSSGDRRVWGGDPIPFLEPELARLNGFPGPGARILDAGTGEGRHLPELRKMRAGIYACDASENALRKIPEEVRAYSHCARCSLAGLPYRSESFSLILLCDVFETFHDPDPALDEMYRVMISGGRLICNIPGRSDGIFDKDMKPLGDNSYLYMGTYVYRFWEEREALDVMDRHGFGIISNNVYSWVEPPHPGFRGDEHEHVSRVFVLEKRARHSEYSA